MTTKHAEGSESAIFACLDLGIEFQKSSGPHRVLDAVDLKVASGEFASIVGQSGAGKFILLRILGDLDRPASRSSVRHRGEEIAAPPEDSRGSLLPWRTVAKNVVLEIEKSTSGAARKERCQEALELVGLADRAKDHRWRLSDGMQQRALLVAPEGWLLRYRPDGS